MRPVRKRAPAWCSSAAPTRRWLGAGAIAFVVGFAAMDLLDASQWVPTAIALVVMSIVDWHWRATRPPSEDGPWSPLARLLYRREP